MSIVLNPITLPASKMLSAMTTLIGEVRFNDTLSPSDIVNDLVDSCRIGKVDFGKGIVYNFPVDTQPTKDLTETSSAFTITKPNFEQETILIDTYKFIPVSKSEILSKDAFLNGTGLDYFFSQIMSLMEKTAQFNLFDVCNNLYQDWVPGQASQTIEIEQIDVSTLTGINRNEALKWNATNIAKVMRKTLNNMKIKNKKFTDVTKYTGQDGNEYDVVSCLNSSDLKLVMNDTYYTNFLADALASLYHSERVGEMIPGSSFVLLPEDAMASKNATTIGWLSDKMKFALADFYTTVMSILDPSTTYENSFYHYAYGTGVFKHAPGVKFVAKMIQPQA